MTATIQFQAYCRRHKRWLGNAASFDSAAIEQAVHRSREGECCGLTETYGICPNCKQARINALGGNGKPLHWDCYNRCATRGLAPASGPETLNL